MKFVCAMCVSVFASECLSVQRGESCYTGEQRYTRIIIIIIYYYYYYYYYYHYYYYYYYYYYTDLSERNLREVCLQHGQVKLELQQLQQQVSAAEQCGASSSAPETLQSI